MTMRVLILAAGLGTRLRPLTNSIPKALVAVGGRPMLEYSLDLFEQYGYREILINAHHFSEQIFTFVQAAKSRWNLQIQVQDESHKLLGSGGAIALAKNWLYEKNSAALVWNPDGLVFPNLHDFEEHHEQAVRRGKLATINLLRHPEVGQRYHPVYFDGGDVVGFGRQAKQTKGEALHFAGAYILEKTAASLLPPPGAECDVAKEVWFPLVEQKRFAGFLYAGPYQDLGTPADVVEGDRRLAAGDFNGVLPRPQPR